MRVRFITVDKSIVCQPTPAAMARRGIYGWVDEYGNLIIWAAYIPLKQWEFVA